MAETPQKLQPEATASGTETKPAAATAAPKATAPVKPKPTPPAQPPAAGPDILSAAAGRRPGPRPTDPPPPEPGPKPEPQPKAEEQEERRHVDFGGLTPRGMPRVRPNEREDYDVSDDLELLSEEEAADIDEIIAREYGPNFKPVFFGTSERKLYAEKRPGFYRHWFNDMPGRIAQAKRAGYKHVEDSEGNPVKRVVGTSSLGGGLTAYLMETPLKWHQEAMAANQRELDKIDEEILAGTIGKKEGDERYVPDRGKAIKISRD